MRAPLERTIVHYGLNDPRQHTGGVETFARNLGLFFSEVLFMTPGTRDEALVRGRRLSVICDNHWVTDWPSDIPVVGFQHGMALRKVLNVGGRGNLRMALRQRLAAKRANTLWVSCAQWMSRAFGRLFGSPAAHVIYHAVDLDSFDGRLDNHASRLLLHDGRVPHKGSLLYPTLQQALPDWRFEPLSCAPEDVPERMRGAAAFLHLSRYEGNSIVCNEAMAMNLPCLLTEVGLMLDGRDKFDLRVIETRRAFGNKRRLVKAVRAFTEELGGRSFAPRRWVLENANRDLTRARWGRVVEQLDGMWR